MTNRSILFAGIIGIGLGIGAYGWAIHRGRTVDAAFLFYTYPIMIVFASSTQPAGRKSPRSIGGMLLAFSGCASILVSAHTGGLLVELLGYALLPLIAAVCWTAYTLLLRNSKTKTPLMQRFRVMFRKYLRWLTSVYFWRDRDCWKIQSGLMQRSGELWSS